MKTRQLLALVSLLFSAAIAFAQSTEPATARVVNLSTRARVRADNPLITGFAIQGTAARTVLVRAAGPALTAFGVADALATPRLRVHDAQGQLLMENAGWADSPALADAFAQAGAFPFARGSADSAVVVTLAPGVYTAVAADAAEKSAGVALLEVYDIDSPAKDSHLVNVSTRTIVGVAPGEEVITGFIVAGTGAKRFLLRGVGPGLTPFGVTDALLNPSLALYDAAGLQLASNEDWSTGSTTASSAAATATIAAIGAIGAAPSRTFTVPVPVVAFRPELELAAAAAGAFALVPGSYDAAFVVTLGPGAYTAQIKSQGVFETPASGSTSGTASGTAVAVAAAVVPKPAQPGVGLLEIYELP